MKKKALLIFFILLGLAGLGVYYVNAVFMPTHFKQILTKKAADVLGRAVSLGEIHIDLMKGIVLRKLTVAEKDDPKTLFLSVDEAVIGIPLPDIIKNRRIVIPSLTLRKPYLRLARINAVEQNFSDLLRKQKPSSSAEPREFILGAITIEQGTIDLVDQTTEPAFIETLTHLDGSVKLSLKDGVRFNVSVLVPGQSSSLRADGNYKLTTRELNARLNATNLDVVRYLSRFPRKPILTLNTAYVDKADLNILFKNPDVTVRGHWAGKTNLMINAATPVQVQGNIPSASLSLTKTDREVTISGQVNAPDAKISIGEEKIMTGNLTAHDLEILLPLSGGVDAKGVLNLSGGSIHIGKDQEFRGNVVAEPFQVTFQNNALTVSGNLAVDEAHLALGNDLSLSGLIAAKNIQLRRENAALTLEGNAEIKNAVVTKGNEMSFTGHVTAPEIILTQSEGVFSLITRLSLDGLQARVMDQKVSGQVTAPFFALALGNGAIHIKGRAETKRLKFLIHDTWMFDGNPGIDFDVSYNPTLKDHALTYDGELLFNGDELSGVPQINDVKSINGKITFNADEARTESLDLVAMDTPLHIAGTVTDFKNPFLKIKAKCATIAIAKITPFFSRHLEKINISPSGEAVNVTVEYTGLLSSPQTADVRAGAHVQNGVLKSPKLPDTITHISGAIQYEKDGLSWENLQGAFQGQDYTLNGSLKNFKKPDVTTEISAQDLSLTTNFTILNENIQIATLKGKYYASAFDLTGQVLFIPDAPPDIALKGRIQCELADLKHLPALKEKIQTLKPSGLLTLTVHDARIAARDWKASLLTLTAAGPGVSLYGYTLNDLSATIEHNTETWSNLHLSAAVYDGKLLLSSLVNLRDTLLPARGSVEIQDLNLAKIKKDIPAIKDKEISGLLSAAMNLDGPLLKSEELRGRAGFVLKEGYLTKVSLGNSLWGFLGVLLIPEFHDIIFTEGQGNFEIANGRATTGDLVLRSPQVDVVAEGWVDFDQNLNMDISAEIHETSILGAGESPRRAMTGILATAANFISYKITGTLSRPQRKLNPLPIKALKNTTGSILEGVGGILEDILSQ